MWFIVGLALAKEEFEVCGAFQEPEGPIDVPVDESVGEIQSSGLAASRAEEGLYYTHDDANGEPRLYLFRDKGGTGEYVGSQNVIGATNTDWEDLASGPCPGSVDAKDCLWIADIGDNDEIRPTISVWVVPESTSEAVLQAVECPLAYPEGKKHDAEALLVSPDGTLRIVTKDKDGAKVFRLDNPKCTGGAAQTLEEEAEIPEAVSVTGAAMSPDGTAVVLRNLDQAWLWSGCALDWAAAPTPLDLGSQPQGEAVTFTPAGDLVVTSEVSGEEPLRYWRVPCHATTTIACEECGCGSGEAALLLLPLAGLLRRRRSR